ncbi:helix-turn-helix domain-containing protein [Amycolatopsis mongoliensis]|uniref:Helix-turn-helix domain-containing protein n=1 Tax=Amycolatopsis mongoliensis TaxID=715475 RepID=A0A9Y2JRE9_9PSEU|nr:TetR/AcrR family transcriptional regulator [Amycolatopsis sp. 4-36]WIY03275.1 helix-turn-helix domain-containing protein [Amycolatopsis sp. 4-36]
MISRSIGHLPTREAILESALGAFTRSGYDGVGVREIAQAAGVTALLVNRYFGSKEGLFAEVVEAAMAERTVLTDDPATLAADIAAALVRRTAPDAGRLDPFLLMLRSAPNPRAAEILRTLIGSTELARADEAVLEKKLEQVFSVLLAE